MGSVAAHDCSSYSCRMQTLFRDLTWPCLWISTELLRLFFIIMQCLLLVLFCWTIDWHFPKRGLPIGSGKSKWDKLRGRKERGFWGPVLFNILPYMVQPGGLSSPISLKQARTLCSDLFWGVKSSPLHSTPRHHNLSISDHTLWSHILGLLTVDFVFLPARIGSTSWQKKFAGPSKFFFLPRSKASFPAQIPWVYDHFRVTVYKKIGRPSFIIKETKNMNMKRFTLLVLHVLSDNIISTQL